MKTKSIVDYKKRLQVKQPLDKEVLTVSTNELKLGLCLTLAVGVLTGLAVALDSKSK